MNTIRLRRLLPTMLMVVLLALPSSAQTQTNAWPLSMEDDQPHKSLAFQWLLRACGERVAVTGKWDDATQSAAQRFLNARRIKPEPLSITDSPPDGSDALCAVKITVGSKNDAVTALQTLLRAKGYDVPTDGVFTSKMKPLVKQVQEHAGLQSFFDSAFGGHYEGPVNDVAVTGDVDANTWAELFAPPRWERGATSYGMGGSEMELLLRAHGYALPKTGGSAAQKMALLKRFQREHNLIADGVVRDPLWSALIVPLSANSRGDAVRAWQLWQKAFAESGDKVRVTGRFDAKARSALGRNGRITWRDWWEARDDYRAREAHSVGS